ncbi:MAG: glycosyltransferase family 39 protein [Candidatus Hydrogenedentota bacterium]
MSSETRALAGSYIRLAVAYFILVTFMWTVGIEGIYGHPAPFYAFLRPAFQFDNLLWIVQAMLVVPTLLFVTLSALKHHRLLESDMGKGTEGRLIAWFILLAFVLPASIAMMRGGLDGISDAYNRQSYEYIGDIGKVGNIKALFARYEEIHEYFSMHAKVHPPGPIVILWLMSYIVGQSPLGLSLATMAFGAFSVVPFYLWIRELFNQRVAIQTTLLYIFVPTIVIFSATSADITFMPFTLFTLFLFTLSINRGTLRYALAAGVMYAFCSLISFSLVSIGAFFGLMGLWKLRESKTRFNVVVTAGGMIASLLLTHYLVWLWSGFNVFNVFELSKAQFDTDQAMLDIYDPRYPSWVFKILNPLSWFYFAGLPVSLLCIRQIFQRGGDHRALFVIIGITLVAFDILYLARGEGERSAMYILPFVLIPAGYFMAQMTQKTNSLQPLALTLAFLALQCWLTEAILYTYW